MTLDYEYRGVYLLTSSDLDTLIDRLLAAESALTLAREQRDAHAQQIATLRADSAIVDGVIDVLDEFNRGFHLAPPTRENLLALTRAMQETDARHVQEKQAAEARATTAERERDEAKRVLQKATTQASRVMQSWCDDEYEALARLGMKFEHEQDSQD